jgi:hypothetical protein
VDSIVDLLKKIAGEEKGRKKKKRNIFHGQNSTEGSVKNGLELEKAYPKQLRWLEGSGYSNKSQYRCWGRSLPG